MAEDSVDWGHSPEELTGGEHLPTQARRHLNPINARPFGIFSEDLF